MKTTTTTSIHQFYIPPICPICTKKMDNTSNCIQLPCLHSYHNECISAWIRIQLQKKSACCAICRRKIVPKNEKNKKFMDENSMIKWSTMIKKKNKNDSNSSKNKQPCIGTPMTSDDDKSELNDDEKNNQNKKRSLQQTIAKQFN